MAGTAIVYSYPASYVRPLGNAVSAQKSNTTGTLPNTGNGSFDVGTKVIFDTALLLSSGTLGGAGPTSVTGTAAVMGKVGHVAAKCDQPCEIRLFFGGSEGATNSPDAIFAQMFQVQDVAPMFVPADVTKWTVWRNIPIYDRFWLPILISVGAASNNWRLHWFIQDGLMA